MRTLQKITTEFVEIEDRLRVTAVTEDGETVVFWFTQRLLKRLIDHCTNWLIKVIPDLAKSAAIANESREEFQTLAQQSAQQEIIEETAVVAQLGSESFLVLEVDLKFDKNSLMLIFKSDQKIHSCLTFTSQNLRQWLSMVYKLWQKAEWPASIWPEWINTSQQKSVKSNAPIH